MKIKVGDATARQIQRYVEEFNCPGRECTECKIFEVCCQNLGEWDLDQEIEVHDE